MDPLSISTAAGGAVRRRLLLQGENPNSADQLPNDDDFSSNFTDSGYSSSISSLQVTASFDPSDIFAWIFTRDTELRDLLALGLEKKGPETLYSGLRRLLVLYAKDLKSLADTPLKSQVSVTFREYTSGVAYHILEQTLEGSNPSQPDFRQVAKFINPYHPYDSDESDDYNDDSSDVDLEDPRFSHVQSLVHFLSSDPPLANLKANLRRFVFPGLEERGTEPKSTEVISDRTDEEAITLGAWISWRRGCICIITLGSIFILLSVFLGVYFTVNKSYGYSMGDAFTLAGFVFAVGTMIDCAVMGYHYPHCKCWKKKTTESISLLSRGASGDSV